MDSKTKHEHLVFSLKIKGRTGKVSDARNLLRKGCARVRVCVCVRVCPQLISQPALREGDIIFVFGKGKRSGEVCVCVCVCAVGEEQLRTQTRVGREGQGHNCLCE